MQPHWPPTEKVLKFNMSFHDSVNKHIFQNIKIKWYWSSNYWIQEPEVICQALETSPASLTLAASTTSLASTASKAQFSQRTSWTWWVDHPWHQNDQYWSFFVEWIMKNPIFHWHLVSSLSEAVEASLCYFFDFFLWNSNGGYVATC